MAEQKFGGPWSVLKLKTLESYLKPYCSALNGKYKLIYVDAFAGSGSFSFQESAASPLFDEEEKIRSVEGSAKIAINCSPNFQQLIFIDQDKKNIASLNDIAKNHPNRFISVRKGDANEKVIEICKTENWRRIRGVIFLDPFGNSVEWTTLQLISRTKAFDVWYLFPLSGVYRQASINPRKLTEEKRASITKVLGTKEWEEYFYKAAFEPTDDLFGYTDDTPSRTVNAEGIIGYVTKRLETEFPYVAPPKILYGQSNAPLYALYLTLSNPDKKAIALARRISQND